MARTAKAARLEYQRLAARLEEVEQLLERELGRSVYLADELVDEENATHEEPESRAWWDAKTDSAASAAGYRAHALGKNINDFFPHPIF